MADLWPFVAYRLTCIAGHEPFRTRFRARMWWHDRRCTSAGGGDQ